MGVQVRERRNTPVKEERNQRLLKFQNELQLQRNRSRIGQEVEILVERRGKYERQWFGHSRGHLGVIVESADELTGRFVTARVVRAMEHTLFGELVCNESLL